MPKQVVIWPFYSQQHKRTGTFLLSTCGACHSTGFLADRLVEMGAVVRVPVPTNRDCTPFACDTVAISIPSHNPSQRLSWDPASIYDVCQGADVVVCQHELMAIPVRRLTRAKVVSILATDPDDELFHLAQRSSDVYAVQSQLAAEALGAQHVWPFAYDERQFRRHRAKDVDVVYVGRPSVTNYCRHEEFLAANARYFPDLRVVYCDPTGYLQQTHPHLEYVTAGTYMSCLRRARVAVSLRDGLYGGFGIRMAVRAGATPVVLDRPCFGGWPYRCEVSGLAECIRQALREPRTVDVSYDSCQASWERAKGVFGCLLR